MRLASQAVVPPRVRLVAAAAGALALAFAVYLADRPAGSAQFLPAAWHSARPLALFGPLGGVLPDFAHAFALSLLTGLLARTRRGALAACLAWWLVDSLAEVAQAPIAAEHLGPHLPALLSAYLRQGTFDVGDLVAVAVGAGLAATLLMTASLERAPGRRDPAAPWSALAVAGLLLLLGSGGGSESASGAVDPPSCSGQLGIDTPTYQDVWQTDLASVDLGGYAPTPGGVARQDCGGFDPGYAITWRNETTGASGAGGAWSRRSGGLLNLCVTEWFAFGVPLAPGPNRLSVSGGSLGGACITIERLPDTTPPAVVSVEPPAGATDVPTNASLAVWFSEDMDASSLDTRTFVLLDPGGSPVPGVVQVDNRRSARFTPAAPLVSQGPTQPGAYTARVTTGARDAAGQNPLAVDYVWSFRTGPVADITPPGVAALDPAADAVCVGTQSPVQVRFDEAVRAETVTPASFFLEDGQNVRLPAAVTLLQSDLVRLQPVSPLAVNARYSATLTTGIRDSAGNALAADVRWSFTTGAEHGTWTRTSAAGAPSPRAYHAAVWTGTEMIVAGGVTFGSGTGARYDPATDRWAPIADAPFELRSPGQVGVWTGTEMIVYGGTVPVLAYNPRSDAWRSASNAAAPVAKSGYTVVWTGAEMIVWGGVTANGTRVPSGARYNPTTDTWRPTALAGAPAAREQHSAVWTGREMIVWGGVSDAGQLVDSGARYDPDTDAWTALPTAAAPTARYGHTAVWAGDAMIVWGFAPGGGRYLPAIDAWRPLSSACAPPVRVAHRVATDGSRMFVFGGATSGYVETFAHGAVYDPVSDTWQAMSAADAPSPRYGHSVVWTGSRAIVWGGSDGGLFDTGGRYAP